MPKIKASYVKCPKCKTKFNSPIFFGDTESFESALTMGNVVQCPKCGNEFGCDKTNMSYVTEDGRSGGVGHEFGR